MKDCNQDKLNRSIDPILTELWEAKKQINQEAGYEIPKLVEMARAAASKVGKSPPT